MRAYSLYVAQCGCITPPDFYPVPEDPSLLHARVVKDCCSGEYSFGTERTMMTNKDYPKPLLHDEADKHWGKIRKLVNKGFAYEDLHGHLKGILEQTF